MSDKTVLAAAFETTPRCNANCLYCYNVWKAHPDYPRGEPDAEGLLRVLDAILKSERVTIVSLTGGEPLLLGDLILEMGAMARLSGKSVNLVTNGSLISKGFAKNLKRLSIRPVEITLLSAREELHDSLQRARTFRSAVSAIRTVADVGGEAIVGIVGTKANIPFLSETLEFAKTLGAKGAMFTRFNPGGQGLRHWQELGPSKEELRSAIKTLMKFADENPNLTITCGVPIPPCVLGFTDYGRVKMGYCNAGGDLIAIDWLGNLRPCNHSSLIAGNILKVPLDELLESKRLKDFMLPVPKMCVGCQFYDLCKGGCRAAAFEMAWWLRKERSAGSIRLSGHTI
ncbi:MAG: radical SAM protein [candidate division WOR-3 bacterium]